MLTETKKCMSKSFTWEGRASRREYWMFQLFLFVGSFIITLIESLMFDSSIFGTIFSLITYPAMIAVSIRRCHDTNRSGWWLWIPIVSFIIMFFEGDYGSNSYGK